MYLLMAYVLSDSHRVNPPLLSWVETMTDRIQVWGTAVNGHQVKTCADRGATHPAPSRRSPVCRW